MPYGLAADLHFHPWSAFSGTTPSGQNTRLVALLSEIDRLCEETRKVGGKVVVLAGDVFHVRGSVIPSVMNSVKDMLSQCVERHGVQFLILAGNHDLEGKNSSRLGSAITALESKDVTVINEPTEAWGNLLVPWYESVEELKEVLTDWKSKIANPGKMDLILHAPIDGVIEGLPAHGLTPAWLASLGFKRVFAGHYHNHKEFPGGVYSIGALAHHTWSDLNSKAGFLIVGDTDVRWMKSHLPSFLDIDSFVDVEPEVMALQIEGQFVRVRLESASSKQVAELREELLTMGAAGVLMQAVPVPPKRDEAVTVTTVAGASLEASIGEFTKKYEDKAALVLKEALSVLSAADSLEV